ncbi:restriction endonuclease subunit S [Enterococcus aquimarinus]|uniref:restriction endonuclease subunit S n=1 Tax=Enterococcus aquimarinus TaxID=328396 RepID=UPI00361C6D81
MGNKKAPVIRFKGYTEDWEQRKFSDLIQTMRGGASIAPDDYKDKGIATVPKGAINSTGIADLSGSKYVSKEFFEKNKNSSVYSDELVTSLRDLVPSAPNMGRIVKLKGKDHRYLMPQGVYNLVLQDEVDENFLISFTNTSKFRKIISQEKNGSTQVHIRNSEYLGISIIIPDSEEQNKIGSFFKQLDATIALHQDAIQHQQGLKKAMLQKLFPVNGARIPTVRFATFKEEWEQRKLGDLSEIVRGASPRPIQDKKWFDSNSNVGWLRISDVTEQNGRITYLEQKISKAGQEKTRVLFEPHLLLSIAATVGKPVVNYVNTGVHDGFLIFLNPIFDREFMFQWLEMFRLKWHKYGQPGSQVNLNSELVRNQEIMIPPIKEQVIIGGFFKQLDDTIALHQDAIHKLQLLKQSFLQKMFIN